MGVPFPIFGGTLSAIWGQKKLGVRFHFFGGHINSHPLVIPKRKKKISKKNIFRNHCKTSSSFQKFNHHIKSRRRRQHINIDSKGILKQSESEEAPNRQEVMGPISIQVSSASLQDQVTFFYFYFTSLI
jgi:hypothetical protein